VLVLVNLLFLSLGTLLFEYAQAKGITIPAKTDQLFPTLALGSLGTFASVVFVLGLTAATFNSADSVLTTLTKSFCIDFLRLNDRTDLDEATRAKRRHWVHVGFAAVLLAVILGFRAFNDASVISTVLKIAGYTYGPLLGLFVLGLTTRFAVRDETTLLVEATAVLQDLGFTIEESAPRLGVLAGAKDRDATEVGQVAGQVALTVGLALLGVRYNPVWDKDQLIRVTLATLPLRSEGAVQMRVSFERIVINNQGLARAERLDAPEFSTGFFEQVRKGLASRGIRA
jgi:hypothetical protein